MRETSPAVPTLVEFQEALLAKRGELIAELRDRFGELVQELAHVAQQDDAPVFHNTFIRERLNDLNTYEELRSVNDALERLATGTFGICQDCSERIGTERLTALPWASRCAGCVRRFCLALERWPNGSRKEGEKRTLRYQVARCG